MSSRSEPVAAQAASAKAAVAAVICAAGASARMGKNVKKEYLPLPGSGAAGLTVLGAVVSAFAKIPEITTIIITVPENPINGEAAARNALPPDVLAGKNGPDIHFANGGATRQASVLNALSLIAALGSERRIRTPGYVLIHDGARPWVSPSLIQRVIAEVRKHGAVIPLLPLTETPKEIDVPLDSSGTGAVFIKQHLKRAVVGAAQTPQGFAFPEILAVHQQAAQDNTAHREFTDDAEIWASFCGPVAAIPGEAENRKITFPEDMPALGGAGC